MSWLKRERTGIKSAKKDARSDVPEGLWTKCDGCGEALFQSVLEEHLWTCPRCDHHFRVPARTYLDVLVDPNRSRSAMQISKRVIRSSSVTRRCAIRSGSKRRNANRNDRCGPVGHARVGGKPVSLTIMDFFFMGGSMGSVVGEKIARSIERAIEERRAVIVVSATGGARMQEGILSLMQMAKTSALLARLRERGCRSCRFSPIPRPPACSPRMPRSAT